MHFFLKCGLIKEKPIGKRETPWEDLAAAVEAEEAGAFPGEAVPPGAFLEEAGEAVPPAADSAALGELVPREAAALVSVRGPLSSMRPITVPAAALAMAALPGIRNPAVAVIAPSVP